MSGSPIWWQKNLFLNSISVQGNTSVVYLTWWLFAWKMIGLDSPGIPEDTVLSFPTFCPNVTNLSPLVENNWAGLSRLSTSEDTVYSFPTFCPNVITCLLSWKVFGLDSPGTPEDTVLSFPIFCPNVTKLYPLMENDWAGLSRYTWRYCALNFLPKCNNLSPLVENDWAGLSRYTWRYCAFLPHFRPSVTYLSSLVERLGWTLQLYLKILCFPSPLFAQM